MEDILWNRRANKKITMVRHQRLKVLEIPLFLDISESFRTSSVRGKGRRGDDIGIRFGVENCSS